MAANILDFLMELISRWLCIFSVKGKSAYANVAHQAGAYPGFRNMKRLGLFLLPPWMGC